MRHATRIRCGIMAAITMGCLWFAVVQHWQTARFTPDQQLATSDTKIAVLEAHLATLESVLHDANLDSDWPDSGPAPRDTAPVLEVKVEVKVEGEVEGGKEDFDLVAQARSLQLAIAERENLIAAQAKRIAREHLRFEAKEQELLDVQALWDFCRDPPDEQAFRAKSKAGQVHEIMQRTRIPHLSFQDANLEDVIQFLSDNSLERSGHELGFLFEPSGVTPPPLTLDMRRATTENALAHVCDISGLEYAVSDGVILLSLKGSAEARAHAALDHLAAAWGLGPGQEQRLRIAFEEAQEIEKPKQQYISGAESSLPVNDRPFSLGSPPGEAGQ